MIWAGTNTQSTTVCSSAGDGLIYTCYKVFPEAVETIRYVTIGRGRYTSFLSQINWIKVNTWSKFSRFFSGSLFSRDPIFADHPAKTKSRKIKNSCYTVIINERQFIKYLLKSCSVGHAKHSRNTKSYKLQVDLRLPSVNWCSREHSIGRSITGHERSPWPAVL